jgi:hypothetical protein
MEVAKMKPTPEAKIRKRIEKVERQKDQSRGRKLDQGLEGTFPASDPVEVTQPPASRQDKRKS